MPFQFDRDDGNRRFKITITDPIDLAELMAVPDRQLAEGAWQYGMLVDARAMSISAPSTDVRMIVSRVRELVAVHGPRGPIAFVARQAAAIGSAHLYTLLGGKTDLLEVFWDMADAKQWLDEQMARSATA